jgi:hypothetical protein
LPSNYAHLDAQISQSHHPFSLLVMNDFSAIVLASGLLGGSLLDLFERVDTESVTTWYA